MPAKWIREYLTFSLKERVAIIILSLMIVVVFLLPQILPVRKSEPSPDEIRQLKAMASALESGIKDSLQSGDRNISILLEHPTSDNSNKSELFIFDPNTASYTDWRRLGLREKTIRTVQNYLSKGGHFNKAPDLGRIYGLRADELRRLMPYLRIKEHRDTIQRKKFYSDPAFPPKSTFLFRRYELKKSTMIDVNTADTAAWVALPGIGNKLASRIINFRNKLGGFYSIDQLAEIYGLPDSTFQKIRPFLKLGNTAVRKIDINTADATQLKQHPYVNWTVANALIRYRQEHGLFKRIEDLQLVVALSPELVKKLTPYLGIRTISELGYKDSLQKY